MSETKLEFVEGWTGPLDLELKADGDEYNLTGLTVSGISKDNTRSLVDLSGDVSILDATAGKVRLNPDTGDFEAEKSPYSLRIKVRDASTQDVYFPSGQAMVLIVREQ
ncbi:MAG TPA: hypothetical protein VLB09_05655 [Nitrospiria bacterium]|nr:hypothetical protein [Nitrospiria bacterium]